mmetsp:Transcript_89377/g.157730  ORF Transcript_89377/g.157730 Transcript_89377/m.157730 type:complete len:281 (+) Transcript_89377:65-907(+)
MADLEQPLQVASVAPVISSEADAASTGKQVSLAAPRTALGADSLASTSAEAGANAAAATSSQPGARPPPLPVPGCDSKATGEAADRPSFATSRTVQQIAQGQYRTLDEPVRETIMRDLRSIYEKLKYVMMPVAKAEKAAKLKDWDLWGPLVLCLALGLTIASQAPDSEQASYAFADVFCIVWAGSGIVTMNALLLRGKVSFFQSVCVLGYCMCPLVLASMASTLFGNMILKVIFVGVGTFWSTGASVGFVEQLVPEDRKALGVFPVWLFYIAIAWMILLA